MINHGFVVADLISELAVAVDTPSGGYPYLVSNLFHAKVFNTPEDARYYLNTINRDLNRINRDHPDSQFQVLQVTLLTRGAV